MRLKVCLKFFLMMAGVLVLLCLPGVVTALAQCAMCRAAISEGSSGAALSKSFNTAVLVLLAPPVAIFCSIFIVAYKHRKPEQENELEEKFEDEQQQ